MGFQKTVLIVALVILTLAIITMATVISKNESEKKWPPEIGTCPPYYVTSLNSDGKLECKLDPDNPNAPKVIPGNAALQGNTECKKYVLQANTGNTINSQKDRCEWAKGCNVIWDGIYNGKGGCDDKNGTPEIINSPEKK